MIFPLAVALTVATGQRAASAAEGGPASAQELDEPTRAAARALGDDGFARYEAGDFAHALDRFERAHALVHRPTTGLWVARCLARLGRLVEAESRYIEVTRMHLEAGAPEVHARAKEEAAMEREALSARVPRLTVRVLGAPAGMAISLDGRPLARELVGVPLPVDPGAHLARATTRDGASAERGITLAEGERAELALTLEAAREPAPGAPPRASRRPLGTAAWALVGTGAALVVVGGALGGVALGKHDDLEAACPGRVCPPPVHGDVDTLDAYRTSSTIALAGGLVVAGVGAVLLLTGRAQASTATGPRWTGLRVVF